MKADSVESITTDLDEIHGELYLENPRKIMHEQLLTSFKYHYTCKKFVILIMHELQLYLQEICYKYLTYSVQCQCCQFCILS